MAQEVHALLTGPVKGNVVTADGTEVEVSPAVIYLDTPEQVHEVAELIGARHMENGHPDFTPDDPFVHEPSTFDPAAFQPTTDATATPEA